MARLYAAERRIFSIEGDAGDGGVRGAARATFLSTL